MERAYREDELLDASIIDSEGYVYGKVDKIKIDENEIMLLAYEGKPDVKTVADIASVKMDLLKSVRTPFGSRFRRVAPSEILDENVRRELALGLDEQLNDDHYLKYAERLGMPVPQVKAALERKEQKGTVTLDEIKTIRITVIGKEKGTKLIKVILLHEPKEAAFRRIPVQKKVPFRSTETIKDKLVLDSDGTALGYVDSVVLFQGMPGIRVYIQKMTGQVSLSLLIRYLEESGQADVASIIRKDLMEGESHRYTVDVEELEDFMHKRKLFFRLPEKVLASQSAREFVADIPWEEISKIGDVVLLKSTSADIRSKGYI
jgi:sporulation protein YlmC with PRC-barrel domain